MITTALLLAHVILALVLTTLILMQHGKGADAGAAFGSGASSTVFGAQGSASFLSRATKWLAILFFVTSGSLAWLASQEREPATSVMEGSLMQQEAAPASDTADEDLPPVEAPAESPPTSEQPVREATDETGAQPEETSSQEDVPPGGN